MKIKSMTRIYLNDFEAVFQCEQCKYEFQASGYLDDDNYENLVDMICPNCGFREEKRK